MYQCRSVKDSDLVVICAFPKDKIELFNIYPAGHHPLTTESLKSIIDSRFDSTVILCKQDIVGFANFYVAEKNRACGIGNVMVKPNMRGKGVGKFLIKTMVDIAKQKHKAKEVKIACFCSNTSALLLYTQLGFMPDFIDQINDPDHNRVGRINFKLLI